LKNELTIIDTRILDPYDKTIVSSCARRGSKFSKLIITQLSIVNNHELSDMGAWMLSAQAIFNHGHFFCSPEFSKSPPFF